MEAAQAQEIDAKQCGVCTQRKRLNLTRYVWIWGCRRGLVYPVRGRCGRMELDEG